MKEQYLSQADIENQILDLKEDLTRRLSHTSSRTFVPALQASALIVTDMQEYFLSPGSHAFIPSAPAIIQNIINLLGIFRQANRPVIFTRHTNSEENAENMGTWWKEMIRPDSDASRIHGDMIKPGDIIVDKNQYDAFHKTGLEEILNKNNARFVVICGVMTNLCCETTTRTAFVKGFQPFLPLDATAAYNREFHISTFVNLSFGFCPMMTTREVIDTLT